MKACAFHADECRATCPGRHYEGDRPASVEPSPAIEPTQISGKLCVVCKGQREKRTGPIEVDLAATIHDCDICSATLRDIERRKQDAATHAKPKPGIDYEATRAAARSGCDVLLYKRPEKKD